jgi:hypothetical protein
MIRADFIPALSWDWPIVPGKIMQGGPEGGGSFRNGLLHSRPLPDMMIWKLGIAPVAHETQDNHATNHSSCEERSKAKHDRDRKQSEAKKSELSLQQPCA